MRFFIAGPFETPEALTETDAFRGNLDSLEVLDDRDYPFMHGTEDQYEVSGNGNGNGNGNGDGAGYGYGYSYSYSYGYGYGYSDGDGDGKGW